MYPVLPTVSKEKSLAKIVNNENHLNIATKHSI